VLWSVVVMLVTPAIYIRLAESEDLADAFRFGEILSLHARAPGRGGRRRDHGFGGQR
jgi:hypothetical protein